MATVNDNGTDNADVTMVIDSVITDTNDRDVTVPLLLILTTCSPSLVVPLLIALLVALVPTPLPVVVPTPSMVTVVLTPLQRRWG